MGFDQSRFAFIHDALNAAGGFAPRISYKQDAGGIYKPTTVDSACYLTPYPRESAKKYAARAAVAVYENHLRTACERFTGYLSKRKPLRDGVSGPLAERFMADADWRNNGLDVFWSWFAVDAKARGSMLLLVDLPRQNPQTLAEQIEQRALPYLSAIPPERVSDYELNEQGDFEWAEINARVTVNGKVLDVLRRWDATTWSIVHKDEVIEAGTHPFGRCPILIFTESGAFPHYGSFEQIALLSRRLYNARSELDEILRGQTFSVLTYQVPADQSATFNGSTVVAELGVNNLLIHTGDKPEFIAPPEGPAKTYIDYIARLQEAIRHASLMVEEPQRAAAESGLALRLRFEALNSNLTTFAQRMEALERRVWDLFARATGQTNRITVSWASDFSLADVQTELDALAAMQMTNFPDVVLREKRKQIVAADFGALDEAAKAEMLQAIDEPSQEIRPPTTNPVRSGVASLPANSGGAAAAATEGAQ